MPGNSPTHRPAAGGVLLALALLLVFIPVVSAEEYSFNYDEVVDYQGVSSSITGSYSMGTAIPIDGIKIHQSQLIYGCEIEHLLIQYPATSIANYASLPDNAVTSVALENWGVADFGYFKYMVGDTPYLHIYVSNIEYTGNYPVDYNDEHFVTFDISPEFIKPTLQGSMGDSMVTDNPLYIGIGTGQLYKNGKYYAYKPGAKCFYSYKSVWHNTLEINTGNGADTINVYRDGHTSNLTIVGSLSTYTDIDNTDYGVLIPTVERPYIVSIINPRSGETYLQNINTDGIIGSSSSSNATATVYVQNSQTGALLANSHLSILASAGGTETEIINATLPGGTATYPLQPTGGGSPNPDYYRAVATVPGFSQIIENHSFTLNGPHDVIIEMRPDTGGPTDPERCYLEFYVRDLNANPIPSASIQCGNRIKTTNSAGYAIFEVDKNASHPWIAKKSGYTTIEGTATVGPNPRYIVNVVLGSGTVPTNPPATDPGGPGATPTPDTRTNEEKGQAVIDMIADNAEGIGALALICLLMGLLKLMVKW